MNGPRIVVVGDALLDVDVDGRAERLCPDAPAPVLDVDTERDRPGGAGLAAAVLAASGATVTLVAAFGDDADADRLRARLRDVRLVPGPADGGTAVKARLRAQGRSLLRLDRGTGRAAPAFGDTVAGGLREALAGAAAVLVSDYGRGVTADPLVRSALADAAARGVPVVWDPHPRGSAPVPGTTIATPNAAEAAAAAGPGSTDTVGGALAVAADLAERWGCRAVVVTLGGRGAVVAQRHGARAASPGRPVAGDPCGAGDVFAGRVAALLAAGSGIDDAVHGAVATAAAFVAGGGAAGFSESCAESCAESGGRVSGGPVAGGPVPGTAAGAPADAARPGGARAGWAGPGIVGPGLAAARAFVERVRAGGGVVVASGGCFDLLHTGHSRTLAAARELGDCLVVLVNSDESVRRLKGPQRPVVTQSERAELLRALGCVDAVVVFDEDDPCAVLDQLRPDLWVKGGDYDPADLPETALLRSWGGEVLAVPYRPGRSTTRLAAAVAGLG